jgi:peptidoglycan-associated lipoprotein
LTDGIATPTVRGFLGFQYPFGPGGNAVAKKEEEEVIENDEPVIEEPEMIVENMNQPEILTDEDDDAFADLTEQNMEEVFEDEGKPAQVAQELPEREVIVTENIFTEPKVAEVRTPTQAKSAQKFILDHVEFDFDSADLDQASLKILNKVLEEIKKVNFKSIKIWGHTDFFGPSVYNEYLGLKRAKAVYDFFKKAGIPEPFVDYDAFGERRPVSVGLQDKQRRKNRRVEVIVFRDEE